MSDMFTEALYKKRKRELCSPNFTDDYEYVPGHGRFFVEPDELSDKSKDSH